MSSTEEINPTDAPENSVGEGIDGDKQTESTDYFGTSSPFASEDKSQQNSPFDKTLEKSSAQFEETPSSETVTIPGTNSSASEPNPEETDQSEEWALLSGKFSNWLKENNFQLKGLRQPLLILAAVIVVFLVLQVYGSVLQAVSHVPAAPRLFQLIGLFWVVYFAVTRLVRSDDRQEVFTSLVDRWKTFSGDEKN